MRGCKKSVGAALRFRKFDARRPHKGSCWRSCSSERKVEARSTALDQGRPGMLARGPAYAERCAISSISSSIALRGAAGLLVSSGARLSRASASCRGDTATGLSGIDPASAVATEARGRATDRRSRRPRGFSTVTCTGVAGTSSTASDDSRASMVTTRPGCASVPAFRVEARSSRAAIKRARRESIWATMRADIPPILRKIAKRSNEQTCPIALRTRAVHGIATGDTGLC